MLRRLPVLGCSQASKRLWRNAAIERCPWPTSRCNRYDGDPRRSAAMVRRVAVPEKLAMANSAPARHRPACRELPRPNLLISQPLVQGESTRPPRVGTRSWPWPTFRTMGLYSVSECSRGCPPFRRRDARAAGLVGSPPGEKLALANLRVTVRPDHMRRGSGVVSGQSVSGRRGLGFAGEEDDAPPGYAVEAGASVDLTDVGVPDAADLTGGRDVAELVRPDC